MLDELADLLVGGRCPGCQQPGLGLCTACRAQLAVLEPRLLDGPVPLAAAGDYDPLLRALLTAHKDRGAIQLAAPLGVLLGAALELLPLAPGVVLVPVPSSPAAVRRRGYDHGRALARSASGRLSTRPPVARLLHRARRVADQSGLGLGERATNQRGSLRATPGSGPVVVTDDICTTGATIAESIRALRAAGWQVVGAAVIAHPRRLRPDGPAPAARKG